MNLKETLLESIEILLKNYDKLGEIGILNLSLLESIEILLKNYDKLGEIGILNLSLSNTITDNDDITKVSTINIEIVPMEDENFGIEELAIKTKMYDKHNKLMFFKIKDLE